MKGVYTANLFSALQCCHWFHLCVYWRHYVARKKNKEQYLQKNYERATSERLTSFVCLVWFEFRFCWRCYFSRWSVQARSWFRNVGYISNNKKYEQKLWYANHWTSLSGLLLDLQKKQLPIGDILIRPMIGTMLCCECKKTRSMILRIFN